MSSKPSSRAEAALLVAPRRNGWRVAWRWAAAGLISVWSLAVLAWLILHWGILPRLDQWRPQIEQRVGQAIGAPLRIGAIRVRSGGWVPAFEIDEVVLLDARGEPALRLGRVAAALSPASLLALQPRLAQLHLDGVELDLRRDADGALHVAGLAMDAQVAADDDGRALRWLLDQHEFVIRRGTLRWTDERRGAPPLRLAGVDLVLRNDGRRHELRLDATPPPEWGDRFALRAKLRDPLRLVDAPGPPWADWRGTVYAELPRADLSALGQYVVLPFELAQGRGGLRAWVDIEHGRPAGATADLALEAVALRLAPQLGPLALSRVHGRATLRQTDQAFEAGIEGLSFETDDGLAWHSSALTLALELALPLHAGAASAEAGTDPWDRVRAGRLQADRLDLTVLARLAARLPLPPALHDALAELAPEGRVHDLALSWRGDARAPPTWQARLRAEGLALAAGAPGPPAWGMEATAGRPGLRGTAVELEASEAGGRATLRLADGALVFPGVFEQPELALAELRAALQWRVQAGAGDAPPAIELTVQEASFTNADARGTLAGSWRTGPGTGSGAGRRYPGLIDLQGRIVQGATRSVARYLPLGIPEPTRRWVERAIGDGRLRDGSFAVRGDLWQFPYADDSPGTFRIRGRAEGMALAYIPSEPGWESPWPAMQEVAGEIEFDRGSMRIRGARARVGEVALEGVQGGIEDLAAPVLRLQGRGSGPLAAMLGFVDATPVGEWIGGALRQARGGGDASLALALAIPIDDAARSTVDGHVQLAGNAMRLTPDTPRMGELQGRVEFSHKGFRIVGARARALGGEVAFEGGTQADGTLRFEGRGVASAEALRAGSDLPALAPLARLGPRLAGRAPYKVELRFVDGWPELDVTSSLEGIALALPAPLDKPAAASWPLRVRTARLGASDADRLTVEIGDRLQANYEREHDGDLVRLRRGAFGVGTAAPALPARGVAAAVELARLDADAWRAAAQAPGSGADAQTARGAAAIDEGLWPSQVALRVGELELAGRRWTEVDAELLRRRLAAETLWLAQLRAREVAGSIEFRQPREGVDPGRVQARLARLALVADPAGEAAAAQAPAAAASAPARMPALDMVVDDFQWRGRALGRLELEAVNREPAAGNAPAARLWQLDRLHIANDDAELQGQGRWSPAQGMTLDFGLALADSGRLLARMGVPGALSGGKGRIDGTLGWAGSPLVPDLPSLDGSLRLALQQGRFLQAEPGVARLLGVLSLQSLPRRLLLDFRDVFQEGFAFDRVSGDVRIERGVAATDNLRLLGVQAGVLVEGRADLRAETQDLRIVVVPELNVGSASLAYAAINPVVGLGSFVAQLLLREPMMAAGTREFRVDGSWSDPQVQRVERVAASPAVAASPGTAAGAASPAAAPAAPPAAGTVAPPAAGTADVGATAASAADNPRSAPQTQEPVPR